MSKFLANNPRLIAFLSLCDGVCRFLPKKRGAASSEAPKSILLCQGAHLGDLVLATAVLPALKERFPRAKIGFLVSSYSAQVLQGHPLVDKVHLLDHWFFSRASLSWFAKWRAYRKSKKKALHEIRGYDLAIDLYPFFPNAAGILYRAGIARRLGYESGGFGPLFTEALPYERGIHVTEAHFRLLERIGVAAVSEPQRPHLPSYPVPSPLTGNYTVIHLGCGLVLKEWEVAKWLTLLRELKAQGKRLVFTGRGAREKERVEAVIRELGEGMSLVDELEWASFCKLIEGAQEVYSVDTVTGHVASSYGVKTHVLFAPCNDPREWLAVGAVMLSPT